MDARSAAQKEALEIVNLVIESLTERIRSGEIADEEGLTDAMHEEIDDSLIYTHTQYLCVFGLPDGDDAIEDGLCSPSNFGEALAAQAYANLRAAVEPHDFSDAFAVASDAAMESEGGAS
jgi:hypothetical protein